MSENLKTFPVIPLRGLTIIPGTTVHFDVRRKASIAAAEESMIDDKELFVVAQKDPVEDTPGFDGIYKVGTVVVVKQLNKLPDDVVRVMVEAKAKGEIQSLYMADGHFAGEVSIIEEDKNTLTEAQEEAYVRELRDTLKLFEGKVRELSPSSLRGLLDISNIETLMNQILMRIKVGYKLKQEYLEQNSIEDKFTTIYSFLAKENEVAQVRNEIIEKVKQRLEKSQKEHILREQMQIIKEELGDDFDAETDQLEEKINNLNADDSVKEKLLKELSRYKSAMGNPAEGNIIRTYLETMLDLPWNNETEENPNLQNAEEILNRDHYQLTKVKERILEFLAVRQLTMAKGEAPIICLVGPPGTGKTSIAKSIAEALNKKYVRISKVLFVATANDAGTIPRPLLDRMEIIEIEGYTQNEKFHIAKEHLISKEFEKNGIKKSWLSITDEAINSIIRYYTREAGVRQLEREISKICRKAAGLIIKNNKKRLKVTSKNIEKYLGRKIFDDDKANEKNDIGIVRGLAWTAVGGTTLQIEVNTMPGKGQLKLTGQLGDVMKESAQIALSYVRSIAGKYGVADDYFEKHDIHIHVPEGAVPKDGPSAGITMATAILSAVTNREVNCKVAMTGEINLRGKVMPIGGLKEKLLAAKNAGIKIVVVPKKNKSMLEEISKEITGGMKIVLAETMDDVIKIALV